MTETTLEEARRCPKCQQPGLLERTTPIPSRGPTGKRLEVTVGAVLQHFVCMNERCRWYGQVCRIVQVNPDGSIPQPTRRRDKHFPTVPDLSKQVNDMLERQVVAELDPDGAKEVRR